MTTNNFMKLKAFLGKFWPIITLTLFVAVIAIVNYRSGTILTGWDNLHPEFNFPLNIQRSYFSVWQEYQGVGLLGGHAHSTDILRQISLYAFSFIFPLSVLRFASMFFMLLTGVLGMYFFLRFLLQQLKPSSEQTLPAFLGALFYLLNLATVQSFYAPFEAFTAHFAALPWLFYGSLAYLTMPSKKHTWLLILALLFALPMAYIPTLFLVYLIVLGIFICTLLIFDHSRRMLLRAGKLLALILVINAFWLLPFFYFTVTSSQVVLNSKINQTATETIFLMNKEFGTLADVPLLRGFWFNSVDPNKAGEFSYMLEPWRNHLAHPFITLLGYLLFLIVIFGAVIGVRRRHPLSISFSVLLLFTFTALAIATPPFSWINDLIRHAVPVLNEAFRFPYTKFSLLAAGVYAVLFSFAVAAILPWIQHKIRGELTHFINTVCTIIVSLFLILFSLPVFQGHLFYDKERLVLPEEYRSLFAYFNTQNPSGRIANLPQHTYWGWNFYNWGYGGSGFLWYGIRQPILDRAFDVWSAASENYYFELSQALYEKDPVKLRQVLDKYQISWLLFDKNIIYPPSPKALFYPDTAELLKKTTGVTLAKRFGEITVYTVEQKAPSSHFITSVTTLPSVNEFGWNADDPAFSDLGLYRTAENPEYIYPFPTLSTLKSETEQTLSISETADEIQFSTPLPVLRSNGILKLPSYATTERIVPVRIRTVKRNTQFIVEAEILSPEIRIGKLTYGSTSTVRPLFLISNTAGSQSKFTLDLNGTSNFPFDTSPRTLTTTFFSLTEPNILSLHVGNAPPRQIRIDPQEIMKLPQFAAREIPLPSSTKPLQLVLRFPRINDPYLAFSITADAFTQVSNCEGFRNGTVDMHIDEIESLQNLQLSSKNATACTSYYTQTQPHDIGYVVRVTSRNTSGRPLHFWVENIDQRRGPIDTFLPAQKTMTTTSYLLPPSETFGKAYAFHFDNIAIGKEQPVNTITALSLSPFPHHFATSFVITRTTSRPSAQNIHTPHVSHPNESLYLVDALPVNDRYLILSQAYDPGWKAYEVQNSKFKIQSFLQASFPFIFGKELKGHTKVNNWANGWSLSANDQGLKTNDHIVIVYLPQYLQYLGFIVTGTTLLFLLLRIRRKKR
jgi:hypothetical protein